MRLRPASAATKDRVSAFKLAAYGATASWLAGVFYLLPVLHVLALLGLYSLYLIYTGVPVLMRVPAERALAFTGVLIAIGLVIGLVIAARHWRPSACTGAEQRGRGGREDQPAGRREPRYGQARQGRQAIGADVQAGRAALR